MAASIRLDPALLRGLRITWPDGWEDADGDAPLPTRLRVPAHIPDAGMYWGVVESAAIERYLGLAEPPTWRDYRAMEAVIEGALRGKFERQEWDAELDAETSRPRVVLRAADFQWHQVRRTRR